jgi:hypothetical protein
MTRIAPGDLINKRLLATSFGEKRRSPFKPKFLAVSAKAVASTRLVAGLLVLRLKLRSLSFALRLSRLANYEAFREHHMAI